MNNRETVEVAHLLTEIRYDGSLVYRLKCFRPNTIPSNAMKRELLVMLWFLNCLQNQETEERETEL